jgi:hypothetical protein
MEYERLSPPVESEALVQAFSPNSILEPGLKVFRRRGRNTLGRPLPFSPGWYYQLRLKEGIQLLFRVNYWRRPLVLGGVSNRD